MKTKKFVIIKDTRESNRKIYNFKNFNDIVIIKDKLEVGDFSLQGFENQIMIERKTLNDLCISVGVEHDRLKAEMERAVQPLKLILIEGNLSDIINENYRSDIHPHSILGTLMAWAIEYNLIPIWVENMREGEIAVYWILREFLRLYTKEEEDGRKQNK